MHILVLNVGSRSLRLRLVDNDAGDAGVVATKDFDESGPGQVADLLDSFLSSLPASVDATAHRVVHGGAHFTSPVVVDAKVRAALGDLDDLAPLHNPPALEGIDAAVRLLPQAPAVACFDTAFHANMPKAASTYALPADWAERFGVRRFGFHGLSCAWSTRRAAALLGRPPEDMRLVVCHLGGGASVTAVAGGRSVDTTMGFTPLEGLPMATRSGDVDPGAILWLLDHGLSPPDLSDGLEHRGGLLGLSGGKTSDMRDILALREQGDEPATTAIAVYLHRLRAKIAAMAAATSGIDVLVFTGGVGEHSVPIRSEACRDLAWLGVGLDESANAAAHGSGDDDISDPAAAVRTFVVPAREELQIAEECRQVL